MSGVDGAVAVVTGVTSGIGAALTRRLCEGGATVVGLARSAERLEAMARPGLLPVVVDLADPAARERAVEAVRARVDRVDLLVNNAAECVYEAPTALQGEAWERLMQVNLLAAIDLCRGLVPLLADDGVVVNLSSVSARYPANARFSPYGVTKAALDAFSDGLRLELSGRGLRVSVLTLGLVDTPIYDKVEGFERTLQKIRAHHPDWLTADDAAEAIEWILTRPARVAVSELVLLPRGQAR